mgnify:CR=1 FL=1
MMAGCFPSVPAARSQARAGDRELIESIQKLMAAGAVDHTIFWRRLSQAVAAGGFEIRTDLGESRNAWVRYFLQ